MVPNKIMVIIVLLYCNAYEGEMKEKKQKWFSNLSYKYKETTENRSVGYALKRRQRTEAYGSNTLKIYVGTKPLI